MMILMMMMGSVSAVDTKLLNIDNDDDHLIHACVIYVYLDDDDDMMVVVIRTSIGIRSVEMMSYNQPHLDCVVLILF